MWNSSSESYTDGSAGDIAMENLYPALIECFAAILCGYVAGRMGLISVAESRGIGTFVGTFSLPALIFLSLAELDLSTVNWTFLLSILIAKAIVFFTVVIVTLLVSRPVNLGRAGLFAIFCTQSNDFAIGYPIVMALYQQIHPEYASYLYLMAPISLAILNPLGFVMMELRKHSYSNNTSEVTQNRNKLLMAITVAKSIATNPIILMTTLGVIGNLAFKHHIPVVLSRVLKVFGSAFSATALFLLGHRMVGKVQVLQGPALVIPGILIAVKMLMLPLVAREVVSLVHPGSNSSETLDLSTYAFLYGTFPAAPGVFVFATQYAIDVDLIASSMVACTFISAPIMIVSAKMVTVNKMEPSDYLQELNSFSLDISIAGIVATIWILILFISSKKYKRVPHKVTCCLVISQLFGCIGIVLWSVLDRSHPWSMYLQFAVYAVGVYSSRLWTAFLSISLLFLQCRSLCFVLKIQPFFIVLGWGGSLLLVTGLLLLADPESVIKRNPNFQYGEMQAAVAAFILILCFIVTVGCLVLQKRYQRRYARYLLLVQDVSGNSTASTVESPLVGQPSVQSSCIESSCGLESDRMHSTVTERQVVDIEEIASGRARLYHGVQPDNEDETRGPGDLCPQRFGCPSSRRDMCHNAVRQYHIEEESETQEIEEDQQTLRHEVLLLLLITSMFIGIAVSIWTLVMEEMSGIYVELSFLDASLNFGQPLLVFAVFGLDVKPVIGPLIRLTRRILYGGVEVKLLPWEELGFETKHVCDQFVTHHLKKCCRDIGRTRRWRLKQYQESFTGVAMVDWLLGEGLARDRVQATEYASHLLEGRVLRHVENLHHFHDQPLLYTFTRNTQNMEVSGT